MSHEEKLGVMYHKGGKLHPMRYVAVKVIFKAIHRVNVNFWEMQ
jgi:hypothetical protein